MARPKRIRKVINPPHFKGYRPMGLPDGNNPIVLNYEEYESIRLSDFELLGQVEASKIMAISRPTYARIYESARRKVAQAFVLGKSIVFEGGKVYYDSEWYKCNQCKCFFNHPDKEQQVIKCALCGAGEIEQIEKDGDNSSAEDICICPKCGTEMKHTPGIPCRMEICSNCNVALIRKVAPHQFRNRNPKC